MKRKPEQVHDDVKAIIKNLGQFDLPTLATIARIDRFEVTDVGSGSSGPKPKHSISDPTGNKVAAKLLGRTKLADPVGAAAQELERTIFDMRKASETLVQQRAYILNPRDRHRDHVVIHCEACGREVAGTSNDRLRSGYCMTCYRVWVKLGKTPRTQFEAFVKTQENNKKSPQNQQLR